MFVCYAATRNDETDLNCKIQNVKTYVFQKQYVTYFKHKSQLKSRSSYLKK